MTTTAVATRDSNHALTVLSNEQLQYIANTEFVPKGLRNNLPAILACVATGRALGIDDMTAIRQIHIIDGKPTFAAELMVMLVRRRGHSITGTVDAESATVTGTRADNGDTMTSAWSLEMAKRAGLLGKGNWKNYPEAMLWARAVSQLCRMLFADCFAGGTYTAEELGDEDLRDSSGGRASSQLARKGPAFVDGGSDDQAPGLGARAPEPNSLEHPEGEPVDDGKFPPPDDVVPEKATDAQRKKLNVLVGKLRPAHVTTEQLWRGCNLNPELGRGEDGELHWSPLRDGLTREQASQLIERLTVLEETVAAQAAAKPRFEVPESARQ